MILGEIVVTGKKYFSSKLGEENKNSLGACCSSDVLTHCLNILNKVKKLNKKGANFAGVRDGCRNEAYSFF